MYFKNYTTAILSTYSQVPRIKTWTSLWWPLFCINTSLHILSKISYLNIYQLPTHLSFLLFLNLNSLLSYQLIYNKPHMFKVYSLISINIPIHAQKVMNISIASSRESLCPFVTDFSLPPGILLDLELSAIIPYI